MAALTALTDGILDMVGTESFLGSIFFGVDKFFIEIFFFFFFDQIFLDQVMLSNSTHSSRLTVSTLAQPQLVNVFILLQSSQ